MDFFLKIAIIGDYNFTYNSHPATNRSLQHAEDILDVSINVYWLRPQEILNDFESIISGYDGFFIPPGPYVSDLYLTQVLLKLEESNAPTFVTGDAFQLFFTEKIKSKNSLSISKNLTLENRFESLNINPVNTQMEKVYSNSPKTEFVSCRYEILPDALKDYIKDGFVLDLKDSFGNPFLMHNAHKEFFYLTFGCPQISSSKDMPHPLILFFIKEIMKNQSQNSKSA